MKKYFTNLVLFLKKICQCYLFFIKLQWNLDKKGVPLILLPPTIKAVNTLVVVLFPGYLLDSLNEKDFNRFMGVLVVFALWEFSVTVIKSFITRATAIHNEIYVNKLNHMLVEKTTTLRQEQLEYTEIYERYEMARKCANANNATHYLGNIITMISTVAVLTSLVYLLKTLPAWLLIVFVLGICIHAVVNILIAERSLEEESELIPIQRNMRYLGYEVMKTIYAKEIRLFNFFSFILSKQRKSIDDFYTTKKSYNKKNIRALSHATIADGVMSVLFYGYNIFRFAAGALSIGMFTISMNAMFRFSQSVNEVVSAIINANAQSIMLMKVKDFLQMTSAHTGTSPVPKLNSGYIEFVNVSYRYPGSEQYALENINIRLNLGEKISIVGPNGAGKTTFIALILGLYKPTQGKIFYNQNDIETMDYSEYKTLFSVLLQDFQIYGFTVLDNILLSPNPSETDRVSALRTIEKAGLSEVVNNLHSQEDTYLSHRFNDKGVELSGGEEQKLAFARVLHRDSPVFILDEPTASLSPRNEYELYKQFSENTKGKTVLFISHRLSSCKLCNRIVVFKNGHITEDGKHETLLKNDALYAEMYAKQAELYV